MPRIASFSSQAFTGLSKVARILAKGIIDTNFDSGTGFDTSVEALATESDGRILVGGDFTGYNNTSGLGRIAQLNTDGSRNTNFNLEGDLDPQPGSGFNDNVTTITVQSDDKILVGGQFTSFNDTTQNRIIRLNANGSRDTTFDIGDGFNDGVTTIAIQSDGKILVGGRFTTYGFAGQSGITRLNTDGSRDTTFDIGSGFGGTGSANPISIAIQSDNKILVSGTFTSYNGVTQNRITRLNTDGSRDSTFDIGTGFDFTVSAIAIQSDDKILVGGGFDSYDGTTQNGITRLNPDGSRDTTFDIGSGFDTNVNSIVIQSDDKILVGGGFDSYDGTTQNGITRLNPDGSRDTTFDIGSGFNASVAAIVIQSDDKILVGGNFTAYNGTTQNRITRLV